MIDDETETGKYVPFPTPTLLGLTTIEWAILVRLSEICRANLTGMTKIGMRMLGSDMVLPIQTVWESLCVLHRLKYVAIADHTGNQYVDETVILSYGQEQILTTSAATQKRTTHVPEPNIKPVRSAPLQPTVAPKPQPKPKQPPAPTSVPVKTRTETELSGYGMM